MSLSFLIWSISVYLHIIHLASTRPYEDAKVPGRGLPCLSGIYLALVSICALMHCKHRASMCATHSTYLCKGRVLCPALQIIPGFMYPQLVEIPSMSYYNLLWLCVNLYLRSDRRNNPGGFRSCISGCCIVKISPRVINEVWGNAGYLSPLKSRGKRIAPLNNMIFQSKRMGNTSKWT